MIVVFTIISASSVSSRDLRGALNLALFNLFLSLEKSMAARECFSTNSKRSQVLAWNVFSLLHPKRLSNVSVIQRFSFFSYNETEQILKETLKLCSCKLSNCILEFKLNADFLEVNYKAENNWSLSLQESKEETNGSFSSCSSPKFRWFVYHQYHYSKDSSPECGWVEEFSQTIKKISLVLVL